jgi:hypothetical protein
MPYFPVDDKLHSHRKAIKAGVEAIGLWTLAGSWASDHGTDGFVPDYIAARIDPHYEDRAARLVTAGLWEVAERGDEKGWQFHEWTGDDMGRRNLTRAEIEQRRREGAERQAKSRQRRMGQTPNVTRDNTVTHMSVTNDSRVTGGNALVSSENVTRDSHVSHTDPPHPTPPHPLKGQNQNPGVALSGPLPKKYPQNGQNEELSEDDRQAMLRKKWRAVSCPEHRSISILSCDPCAAEHKSPSHWTRHEYPSGAPK